MSNIQTKPRIRKEPGGEWYVAVKSKNFEAMVIAQHLCNRYNWNLLMQTSGPMIVKPLRGRHGI